MKWFRKSKPKLSIGVSMTPTLFLDPVDWLSEDEIDRIDSDTAAMFAWANDIEREHGWATCARHMRFYATERLRLITEIDKLKHGAQ